MDSRLFLPNLQAQPSSNVSQTPHTQQLDGLMSGIANAIGDTGLKPVGTFYRPGVVRPDQTSSGGIVPTARRYRIVTDKIMIPYKDDGAPRVGRDGFLSGDVTEADLHAAGCNIAYLVAAGHIVEDGFVRI